ncbi:hypothetical protein BJ085DRAFT_27887 [Dimargaris cristalligena]|uniref:Uncharacterized protein n=1 Tax=Dimargaris cristalligena TaxID=215637 RepID=A0A4P9ZQY3_9FUNG|nr:hypothetical protein BJ085DRAFT_27887 [Dimargaris cristalligena]|eukprot:RKP35052.1 hypothetical protein BJ085DRAFT_27887 [Dimargaris cristalligena]
MAHRFMRQVTAFMVSRRPPLSKGSTDIVLAASKTCRIQLVFRCTIFETNHVGVSKPLITTKTTNETTHFRQLTQEAIPSLQSWRPEGTLVAFFKDHTAAIKDISLSTSQALFATASDDMKV